MLIGIKENCTFNNYVNFFYLGVEFIKDNGIYLKDQTWKFAGCDFYFPGAYEQQNVCPPMIRPVCYVYNGAICCASECPGIASTYSSKIH